jgi:phosphoribosylamine--glycine ligase
MNVLLIGRWGKTHAFAKALAESKNVELYALMDQKNTGIARLCTDYDLCDIKDVEKIDQYADDNHIDMVLSVPELSLEQGITDHFNDRGIPAVGPTEFCTKLEGDKGFLRNLMKENDINAFPDFNIFFDETGAINFIKRCDYPVAVKPAGITEGDGVKVEGIQLDDKKDAIRYIKEIFGNSIGGLANVIIEEKITGEEFTVQYICDGKNIVPTPAVRDYKLLNNGDSGLNTPGMGSYTDKDFMLPFLNENILAESRDIIRKILDVLRVKYNKKYKGFLSGQFMLTKDGVKLIEINVRPGDSEILNITPILRSDFTAMCMAIHEEKLDETDIEFEQKATVCKYVVPEGFPTPEGVFEVEIDHDEIDRLGVDLFQSCFEEDGNLYRPSPRLFAITAKGNSIEEANELCERGIACIKGDKLFHRHDIGTRQLIDNYKRFDFLGDEDLELED